MENTVWQSIVDTDFAMPEGQSAAQLLPELLMMLGSTDPVARDEYAYPILGTWIERDMYTPTELRALGQAMAANFQVGIGEVKGDAVFLRSFSALILVCVIEYDNVHLFLDEQEVRIWLDDGLRCISTSGILRAACISNSRLARSRPPLLPRSVLRSKRLCAHLTLGFTA